MFQFVGQNDFSTFNADIAFKIGGVVFSTNQFAIGANEHWRVLARPRVHSTEFSNYFEDSSAPILYLIAR